MSDSKEFTKSDLIEFCEYAGLRIGKNIDIRQQVALLADDFIKSKQPIAEYEILSFKGDTKVFGEDKFFTLVSDDIYLDVKCNMPNSLNSLLNEGFSVKSGQVHIYSVKRLSDGEVFSLGDKVKLIINKDSVSKTIIKIAFEKLGKCPEQLFIYTDGEQSTINNYEKAKPKQVLFTTEDGVEIFNNMRYWVVSPINWLIASYDTNDFHWWHHNMDKPFSSKEAAEQYILENKPIQVSYKELESFYLKENDYPAKTMIDFFKSKINP